MHREHQTAFRRTSYRVRTPGGELLLRVDHQAPALGELLHECGASGAALLTAFNPGGRRAPPLRNRQAQHRLRRELAALALPVLPGCNEDPRGLWPVEPSLLVPGLQLQAARTIAARYGQLAFLWSGCDATPRLIETATASAWFSRPRKPR